MLVVSRDSALYAVLDRLAAARRAVFFTGLPGMGKSLMIQQLAHLASAAGRRIHLLQWDVARPVFEASKAGQAYPLVDGITHVVIRKAVGLWARRAIADWQRAYPAPEHLLIGEAPLVGGRLIELARPAADAAEPVLSAESSSFAIPVPSRDVRHFLESERERRAARPGHAREREDAPPDLLRELWRALVTVGCELGVPGTAAAAAATRLNVTDAHADAGGAPPYDPLVYQRVYERVLARRRVDAIMVDAVLSTTGSAYDFAIAREELTPSAADAARCIREVEHRYPDLARLQRETERWYVG